MTDLHYKVMDVAKFCNDCFGVPIALGFFSNCISVIADIHYMILVVFNHFSNGDKRLRGMSKTYMIFNLLWIFIHFVHFIFLIKPWTILVNKETYRNGSNKIRNTLA
ncbi:hypothetical protein FQR65_LT04268 [Abscondita terminalis]|nr:hypothetical protein FQR65_LT04268 [Abscondita terminalis]